jgi:hypothetical protein
MKLKKLTYTKFTTGEAISVVVPVVEPGDTRGNRPKPADTRPWGKIPEGFELLKSHEGWENGWQEFLAPVGAKFRRLAKGSPHCCSTWECYIEQN